MTTNYRRGAEHERAVMEDMEGYGYWVMRSAGSHGTIDIIAKRRDELWVVIQCKRHGRLDPPEWNALYRLATHELEAIPILAEKGPWGTGIRYWKLMGEKTAYQRYPPVIAWKPTKLEIGGIV